MGFFELFSGGLAALYALVPNYALAIILLTFVVRLLLLPLTIKQTRSMREMQLIQPEIKKIQAKYRALGDKAKKKSDVAARRAAVAENRRKMNEEMMGLYKEHGVNPMGGCLPLLLQMPVFIALFNVLQRPLAYLGFRAVPDDDPTEWVARGGDALQALQDSALAQGLLEVPDKINSVLGLFRLDCSATAVLPFGGEPAAMIGTASACPRGILAALPYLVLIALMGATTFYSQRQMMAARGSAPQDPQAQQQQAIMKYMPLLFVVFGFGFPAGLTLYWTTSNVWTIGQQYLMLRVVPPVGGADKGGDGPDGKAPSKASAKPDGSRPPRRSTQKPAQTEDEARPPARAGRGSAPSPHKKKKR